MISITKSLFEQIIEYSKKEFPNEACGILAGKNGKIKNIYEMKNVDKSPESYLMDAKEQLKVMKEIRKLDLEMIAIYHSHVASAAYPSAHDVEMAFYPDASYVIVSLKDKNNPNIRSFRIIDAKISEEEIRIE